MVLRVNLDEFPATVRRMLSVHHAFASPFGAGTLVTSADPVKNLLIAATTPLQMDAVRKNLQDADLEVFEGAWQSDEIQAEQRQGGYVAAVAYRSKDASPGLWVDAFPYHPTQADVLKAMYDEFLATGEMREVSFDDFFKLAHPNVLILPPEDIDAFARKKEEC